MNPVRRTPRMDRWIPRDWWGVRRTRDQASPRRCDALPGWIGGFHAAGGECVAPETRLSPPVRRTPRTDRWIPRGWRECVAPETARWCDALPDGSVDSTVGGECLHQRPGFSAGATHSPDGSVDSTRLAGSALHQRPGFALVRRTPRTDRWIPRAGGGVVAPETRSVRRTPRMDRWIPRGWWGSASHQRPGFSALMRRTPWMDRWIPRGWWGVRRTRDQAFSRCDALPGWIGGFHVLVGSASHQRPGFSASVRRTPRTDRWIPRGWWGVRRTRDQASPRRCDALPGWIGGFHAAGRGVRRTRDQASPRRCDALPGRIGGFHAAGGECVAPETRLLRVGATHSPDGSVDSTRLAGSASHRVDQAATRR